MKGMLDDKARLFHILDAIREIENYVPVFKNQLLHIQITLEIFTYTFGLNNPKFFSIEHP